MKRASLSRVPLKPAAESRDLTDRLLDEAKPAQRSRPPQAAAQPAASPGAPAAPAAVPALARKRATKTSRPKPPAQAAAPASPPSDMNDALRQAEAAADSLRQAAQLGEARYALGLRYRLDALAHHIRQVAEYVAASRGE